MIPARLAAGAAVVTVWSAATCAGPAPPRAARKAASVSLLDAIGSAAIDCPDLATLRGELDAGSREPALFADPFDANPGADGWLEGREVSAADAAPVRLRVRDPIEGIDVLFVPSGAGGVHRIAPIAERGTLVIVARLRAAVADGAAFRLAAHSLSELPEGVDARRALVEAQRSQEQRVRSWGRVAGAGNADGDRSRGDGWQSVALLLPPDPARRALRLSLLEGAGLLADEIVVRRAAPLEQIAAASEDPAQPDRHPLIARARAASTEMRSLLLPAGSRVRFTVDLSRVAPRLDAGVASHPLASSRAVRVACAVAGTAVSTRSVAGDAEGFVPWQVALAPWAGRRVELELAAEGEPGAVAVLGDPWVLAGPTPAPGSGLLLISIDTLRRDALGCYGSPDARTPAIDALAAAGACFTRATAPASYTLPSHASLFSGQHPLVHGVVDASRAIDPRRTPLLAERLAAAGWQTAAFTGGGYLHPDFGFSRGFGSYSFRDFSGVDFMFQERPAPLSADGASFAGLAPVLDWLERRADQPFFLLVHTYFVHNYVPSPDFAARRGARLRPDILREADGSRTEDVTGRMVALEALPGSGPELQRLYQAAVDETDERVVAPLLAALDRLGLSDRTIVALVSDHGEGFLEHGQLNHGRSLWRELVDVPLILRGPAIPRGARRDDPVALEDVAATLLARLGVPGDERCTGRDLFAAPEETGEPRPRLLHLANLDHHREHRWDGLLLGRYALLRERPGDPDPRRYLYDMAADPLQQRDLAAAQPERVRELERRLEAEARASIELAARLPGGSAERGGDRDALERRLRELGYGVR